jgi:hypothetical protein
MFMGKPSYYPSTRNRPKKQLTGQTGDLVQTRFLFLANHQTQRSKLKTHD